MKFTNWNRENFDYLWTKYFFYDITRLVHLAGLGRLPEFIIIGSSIGIDLNDFGINLGLLSLIGSYLVGKFILSRKVLSFQQKGLLDNRRAWSYLNSLQSELGRVFLRIERIYRKARSSWHRWHVSKQNRKNLSKMHLFDSSLTKNEKRHLQKWQVHQQMQLLSERELILYDARKKIHHVLATIEKDFFKRLKQTDAAMTNAYKEQARSSFKNLTAVIHGFFETFKARYYSMILDPDIDISQIADIYLSFWKRYESLEQEELFKFLEQNTTEDSFYLRSGLNLMADDETLNESVRVSEEPDILLERMLEEVRLFFDENWPAFEYYVNNQEMESFLRNYSSRESLDKLKEVIDSDKKEETRDRLKGYEYDLERFFQTQKGQESSLAYNYDLERFFKDRDAKCADALVRK